MRNVLLAILMVALFLNPASAEELTGTLQQIQKSGKIKIGYRTSLPPMSSIRRIVRPKAILLISVSEL